MKSKSSDTMAQSVGRMLLTSPVSLLLLAMLVVCPVNGSQEGPKEVVSKLADTSLLLPSSSLPKRQIPNVNRHAPAQPYPYSHNYNEQRGDIRDTTSRHNQNTFQRRADVGSENKRLSDNNNYNGNRFLGSNNDVVSGQKKDSQDTYDPFYFFQPQSRGQNLNQNQVNHHQQHQTSYQRQRGDLHSGPIVAVNPPRNRRNSHNINNSQNNYFDLNAEKYNILTKSAYPLDNHFAYANAYPTSYRSHHNAHHHQDHHHNPNQFLSQDQLLRQGTNRHVHGSNSLDYYGGAGAYSNSNRGRGDVPWSVQIGTQLKVNDDGRAPNPTQFYIRDERTGPPHNRRHPIYRK